MEITIPLADLWRVMPNDTLMHHAQRIASNPYDAPSWNALLSSSLGILPSATARAVAAHLRSMFPMAYSPLAHVLHSQPAQVVKTVLRSCIADSHSVELWSVYLDMVEPTLSKEAFAKAARACLAEVGTDPACGVVWRRLLAVTPDPRVLYHECLTLPLWDLSGLLASYLALERESGAGRNVVLSEGAQASYRKASDVAHALRDLYVPVHTAAKTRGFSFPSPLAPNTDASGRRDMGRSDDNAVAGAWRAIIAYEESDPMGLGKEGCSPRVVHVYRCALSVCSHDTELWVKLHMFQDGLVGGYDAAQATLLRASLLLPTNLTLCALRCLHLCRRPTPQTAGVVGAAMGGFKGVDTESSTLAVMLHMHMIISLAPTPTQGMDEARTTALRAIKTCSWHLFPFLADLELRTTRNVALASRILHNAQTELGVDNTAFVHRLVDIMVHFHNVSNVGVILEKAMQRAPEGSRRNALWGRYMEVLKTYTPLWQLPPYELRRYCASQGASAQVPTGQSALTCLHGPVHMRIALERYTVDGRAPIPSEEHAAILEKDRLWRGHHDEVLAALQKGLGMTLEVVAAASSLPRHTNPFGTATPSLPLASSLKPFVVPRNPNPMNARQDQDVVYEVLYAKGMVETWQPPAFTMHDLTTAAVANVPEVVAPVRSPIPRLVARLLKALPRGLEASDRSPTVDYVMRVLVGAELAPCPASLAVGGGRGGRDKDRDDEKDNPAKRRMMKKDKLMTRLS